MISKEALQEFRGIYFQTYGKELSFDEATAQAHQLIRFCKFALGYPLTFTTEDKENE